MLIFPKPQPRIHIVILLDVLQLGGWEVALETVMTSYGVCMPCICMGIHQALAELLSHLVNANVS